MFYGSKVVLSTGFSKSRLDHAKVGYFRTNNFNKSLLYSYWNFRGIRYYIIHWKQQVPNTQRSLFPTAQLQKISYFHNYWNSEKSAINILKRKKISATLIYLCIKINSSDFSLFHHRALSTYFFDTSALLQRPAYIPALLTNTHVGADPHVPLRR